MFDEQPWKNPKTPARTSSAADCWTNFNEKTRDLLNAAIAIGAHGISAPLLPPPVKRKLDAAFVTYLAAVGSDVKRIAKVAMRKKFVPSWMDLDDVMGEVRALLWDYMFVREDASGVVGFSSENGSSPGVWLHWKTNRKLWKGLSKKRKECQHCRGAGGLDKTGEPKKNGRGEVICSACSGYEKLHGKMPGAAPEYLSKTGELPDLVEESTAEAICERALQRKKLAKLKNTVQEFAMLEALTRGDEPRIVAYLIEMKAYDDPDVALRAVNAFVASYGKKHAPRPRVAAAA